jgi:hypothetical protein
MLAMSLRFTFCQALLLGGLISEATSETRRLVDDRARTLGSEHPETRRTVRLLEEIEEIPPSQPA